MEKIMAKFEVLTLDLPGGNDECYVGVYRTRFEPGTFLLQIGSRTLEKTYLVLNFALSCLFLVYQSNVDVSVYILK
jgi:hypothetical protein